jgi:hypothetical protein
MYVDNESLKKAHKVPFIILLPLAYRSLGILPKQDLASDKGYVA